MSEVIVDPTAAAPAAAPAPAAAAPAPKPAESLFAAAPPPADPNAAPAAAPAAAAPAAADELAWLPEKYRVKDAEGKLDIAASSKKLGEGYAAAEKRIGTGAIAPETPDAYKFTPPEALKDVPLDEGLTKSFREKAHKAGFTQDQFQFVMSEYFDMVPALLDGKTAATAAEAREQLQKVWATPADLAANMSSAERAVAGVPESMREELKTRYGTDPLFWQFAAHYGKQMQEDRPPTGTVTTAAPSDVDALMATPAYRDKKHPEHAAVSARVVEIQKKRYGEQPAM